MKWNYRVAANIDDDCYDMLEVYYNDNESGIAGYIKADINGWEHVADMKGTLHKMLEAFDKPVLELDDGVLKE